MRFSICLPYMKEGITRKDFHEWFRAIDDGPFHALSCGERIGGPTYEMRQVLAAAAAITERVRIVPSLYVLPMHNAVWAAKELATLDVLSEGRVTLTVGVGGRETDYAAVDGNFKNRFKRMDEQIAVMKRVWAGEPPYEGAEIVGPMPVQEGGPPIWAGAMGPKSIRRVAHWADGLYGFAMNGEADLIKHFFDSAEDAWQEAGRTTKPELIGGFWYSQADNAKSALAKYVYDYLEILDKGIAKDTAEAMVMHDEGAIRASIDAIEALGCEELYVVPATADIEEVTRMAKIIESR